jgi:CheY-like chemotaxis protein
MNLSSYPVRLHSQPVPPLVLVIEDSDEDYEALRRSFRQSPIETRLHRCQTGKQALDYLEQAIGSQPNQPNAIPAFILLDLNLPGIDGRSVLRTIKQDPVLQYIPTIVLTTSDFAKDIDECYRFGANSYILKAIDLQRFKESILVTIDFWLNIAKLPEVTSLIRPEVSTKVGVIESECEKF